MKINLTWNVNKLPQFYLDQASELQIDTDGSGSVRGSPEFYVWARCLRYLINFPSSIDYKDINDSIRLTLIGCLRDQDFDEKKFLDRLNKEISSKRNRRRTLKYLESYLSISFPHALEEFQVFKSLIKVYTDKFEVYSRVLVEQETSSNELTSHLKNLNLFRAVLCYFLNSGQVIDFSDDTIKEPINKVKLGEEFKLYTINSVLISEKKEKKIAKNNYQRVIADQSVIANAKKFIKNLESSNYSDIIKQTLLLYVNALDEFDHNVSFILLWNCLDNLTNTEKGKYEEVINRVSSLYPNMKYHEVVLDYCKRLINLT